MKKYGNKILALFLGAALLIGEAVIPVSAEEKLSGTKMFFSQEDLGTDIQKVISSLPQKEEVDGMTQEELTELREDMIALRDRLNCLTQEEYAALTGTDSAMELLDYVLEKATAGDEPVGGIIKDENHKVSLVENNTAGLMRSGMASKYVPAAGSLPLTRNQNPYGTCWAFASIAGVEGDAIKTYGIPAGSIDLSEAHLAYFTNYGDCQMFSNRGVNWLEGGNYAMSSSALLHWIGAAQESVAPYQNLTRGFNESLQYQDAYHVQGYYEFDIKQNPDLAKQMILEHGMIGINYYSSGDSSGGSYYNSKNNAYYCNVSTNPDHAVAVVGWDDSFPRTNFSNSAQPTKDGAWLVRNTWVSGADIGNMGYTTYFWMSYEDKGLDNMAVAFDVEPTDNYDYNYQYDNAEMLQLSLEGTKSFDYANIYTIHPSSAAEKVKAVGIYMGAANTRYTIQVYKNFKDVSDLASATKIAGACASGQIGAQGFYTIPLSSEVTLRGGEKIAVVIQLYNDSYVTVGIENPWVGDYSSGQSAIGEGGYWEDVENIPITTDGTTLKNFVLKVYTDATTPSTYSISYQLNGGTNHKSNLSRYSTGTNVTLYNPTRKGYTFGGWYTSSSFSGNKVTSIAGISRDYTLYAKWSPIKYKVKFNKNGLKLSGSFSSKTYKYGSKYTLPKTSTKKKGYDLVWNTKKKGKGTSYQAGTKVKNLTTSNGKTITLYAKWQKHKYKISYQLKGGKNSSKNPTGYYITSKTIKLKNPTRKGYKFMGWYSDKKYKNKVTQIKKGTTGNKTLYAKWKKK